MNKEYLNKINQLIDKMVDDLKKELLSGAEYKPRYTPGSFWDRIKRFWTNAYWGANSPENPYVHKNKFGALGEKVPEEYEAPEEKKENFIIPLYQYKFLNEQYNLLENQIINLNEDFNSSENIKNLKLFRIIDDWSSKFKKEIEKLFSTAPEPAPVPPKGEETRLERMPADPRSAEKMDAASAKVATAPIPTPAPTPEPAATSSSVPDTSASKKKTRGRRADQIWSPENGWIGLGYVLSDSGWNLEENIPKNKLTRLNKIKKLTKNIFEEDRYFLSFLQDFHTEISNLAEDEKDKLKNANIESWFKVFQEKIDRLGDDDLFFGGLDGIVVR